MVDRGVAMTLLQCEKCYNFYGIRFGPLYLEVSRICALNVPFEIMQRSRVEGEPFDCPGFKENSND
jgi:hypothetical protein